MIRVVLPSTSPTTKLSCAKTQRNCRDSVNLIPYFLRRAAGRTVLRRAVGLLATALVAIRRAATGLLRFFATFLTTFAGLAALFPGLALRRLCMADPISAGDRTVVIPAASSASNFAAAVPLPPATMAPA